MVSTEPAALKNQQLTQAKSDLGTFWHRARSAAIARKLTEIGADEVADIGAGAGHLGGWLAAHHPAVRYRFLEPMTDLCDHLATRFGAEDRLDGLEAVATADAVTMLDVLEHIEDDHGFIGDVFKHLQGGGHLFLTVPAHRWLFSAWDSQLGHHRRYARSGLRAVVESAGFEVTSITHLFPELVPPALLRRARGGASDGSAEFPELPVVVDRIAYAVARATTSVDRLWPVGTSILLAARKR